MPISKYVDCPSYPALVEVHEMLLRAQGTASLSLPEWRQKFDAMLVVVDAEWHVLNDAPERPVGTVISAPTPRQLAADIAAEDGDDDPDDDVEIPEPDPRFARVAALGTDAIETVPEVMDAIETADLDEGDHDEVEVPEPVVAAPEPIGKANFDGEEITVYAGDDPAFAEDSEPAPVPNIRNIRRIAEYREPVLSQQELDEVEDQIAEELSPEPDPVDSDDSEEALEAALEGVDEVDEIDDSEDLDEHAGDEDDPEDDDSES